MTSQITTTSPFPVSRRFIRLRTLGTLDLSVEGAGVELRAVLRQPKRLALLAYLALAQSRGFHRRDSLVALFWPELDEEHARGALRQAVHFLRRHLGMEAIVSRGEEELRIGGNTWCDAAAFEHAASANRLEEAIALYRGDLLAGFHVSDAAPELDQWIENERTRLREIAAKSAWSLAVKSELARDVVAATHWGRMAMRLSLHNEVVLRRLVSLLDRMGDCSSALRVYEEFALRLKTDFDEEPSPETQALVATLGTRVPAAPIHQMQPAPLPRQKTTTGGAGPTEPIGAATRAESPSPVSELRPLPRPTWRSRGVVQMVSLTAAATALIATAAIARRSPEASTVLAVGAIRDHTGGEGANVSAA
ncbi:MAG: hypothetical protein M3125_03145, partial [Gemmatimonadota bacterium]|nr:hypothetical protein [Gemmatimonadota bacterium]